MEGKYFPKTATNQKEQERQRKYDVTLRGFRLTTVAVEKQ
jgi:hypothetical protein